MSGASISLSLWLRIDLISVIENFYSHLNAQSEIFFGIPTFILMWKA